MPVTTAPSDASRRTPIVWLDLQWFDKAATRLPEALWFTFAFAGTSLDGWRLQKLGQLVSPLEVVANGNRKLHAILDGARYGSCPEEPSRRTNGGRMTTTLLGSAEAVATYRVGGPTS
jgi:hypothetical protein